MNNDDLINYGLNHGDPKVRQLAAVFGEFRDAALKVVYKVDLNKIILNKRYGKFGGSETSGERYPMYANKR